MTLIDILERFEYHILLSDESDDRLLEQLTTLADYASAILELFVNDGREALTDRATTCSAPARSPTPPGGIVQVPPGARKAATTGEGAALPGPSGEPAPGLALRPSARRWPLDSGGSPCQLSGETTDQRGPIDPKRPGQLGPVGAFSERLVHRLLQRPLRPAPERRRRSRGRPA
jgi:hypothetical protein